MNWKRLKFPVKGIGILAAMVYLVVLGIQATGLPYMKVGELISDPPEKPR